MRTIKELASMKLRTTPSQKKKISNIVLTALHLEVSIEVTARGYRYIEAVETDSNGKTTWKAFAQFVPLPLAERSFLVKIADNFDVGIYQK